jgi:hypothetical protein
MIGELSRKTQKSEYFERVPPSTAGDQRFTDEWVGTGKRLTYLGFSN